MRGIISADWHIRVDKPRCRLDSDWILTQRQAIKFIVETANKRNCPVYHCGDLFNSSSVSDSVWNMVTEELHNLVFPFYFITGNHDLPFHSLKSLKDSSIWSLFYMNTAKYKSMPVANPSKEEEYEADHFRSDNNWKVVGENTSIFFLHSLIFKDKKSMGMAQGLTAGELLEKFPKRIKTIFTGDNHHSFIYESEGRRVVNPGCILRQAADLISYKPSIYFVDTKKDIYEKILIPDDEEMVTDEYLVEEAKRENRIEAFVEKVKSNSGLSLSFTNNLKEVMKNKKIPSEVEKVVYQIFEEAGIEL